MLGDTGGARGQTADDAHPAEILGEAENGGLDREVPWRPFHRHLRGDTGRHTSPHHIQYGGRHGNYILGYSGGREGGRPRGIWEGSPDSL